MKIKKKENNSYKLIIKWFIVPLIIYFGFILLCSEAYIRQSKNIVMITKERSTKIKILITPGFCIEHDHNSHTENYFISLNMFFSTPGHGSSEKQ